MNKAKQEFLQKFVDDLKSVKGIIAIVLGGSQAQGSATDNSDIDIGIYYRAEDPFSIPDLQSIIQRYDSRNSTLTDFYGWGKWINGGGWLSTEAGQVDLIYRNLDQVHEAIKKAREGHVDFDFEEQPPYGFSSLIYLAETKVCVPLYDPKSYIERLKSEVSSYPSALKEIVVKQSLWAAEFSLWHARHFIKSQDLFNIAGCLTRSVKAIVSALYAINEIYPLGDKRAIQELSGAKLGPERLKEKIDAILSLQKSTLANNIQLLDELHTEVAQLAGNYKPMFHLKNDLVSSTPTA